MDGIINVYKEKGMTSFDVLRALRRILREKKMGHTGTLDPMAEGVLLVCVGKATKYVDALMAKEKIYQAELTLGIETDTEDSTGKILSEEEVSISKEDIEKILPRFLGKQEQIPPMYSAKKLDGKKLYELAREGKTVERKPSQIEIFALEILSYDCPKLRFRIHCSKGTYIRTLCKDIGEALGTKACMSALLREQVGEFSLKESYRLSEIEKLEGEGKRDTYLLPPLYSKENTILTFGKFDGLHLGHQKIFEELFKEGKAENLVPSVLSFTTHPSALFSGERQDLLCTEDEHYTRLQNAGFSQIFLFPLTLETAKMPPEKFLEEILVKALKVKHLVVGTDCSFGYKGKGNVALLREKAEVFGYKLTVVEKALTRDATGKSVEISSTYIRKCLEEGAVEETARLLGRYYTLSGTVVHGKKIGRSINFPTANILPKEGKLCPMEGVYHTRVLLGKDYYEGMTSIGKNPSVAENNPLTIETHILGFQGDIYGEKLRLEFVSFIREQRHFQDIEELKAQLEKDLAFVEEESKKQES